MPTELLPMPPAELTAGTTRPTTAAGLTTPGAQKAFETLVRIEEALATRIREAEQAALGVASNLDLTFTGRVNELRRHAERILAAIVPAAVEVETALVGGVRRLEQAIANKVAQRAASRTPAQAALLAEVRATLAALGSDQRDELLIEAVRLEDTETLEAVCTWPRALQATPRTRLVGTLRDVTDFPALHAAYVRAVGADLTIERREVDAIARAGCWEVSLAVYSVERRLGHRVADLAEKMPGLQRLRDLRAGWQLSGFDGFSDQDGQALVEEANRARVAADELIRQRAAAFEVQDAV